MIIEYIRKYGKAKKKDIRELLWDKLPDVFDDKKEQQNFYTVDVIETKRSDYKRLSKSANFELDSCWKCKKNR